MPVKLDKRLVGIMCASGDASAYVGVDWIVARTLSPLIHYFVLTDFE